MKLRDYQTEDVQASLNFLFYGKENSALVLEPTGVGKSVIIADTTRQTKLYYPPARILMLTHSKELVEQNHAKAQSMIKDYKVGLWHAGMRKKETDSDILFAGIDTVANNPQLLGQRHIVMIDEAHRVSPRLNTNYRKVCAAIKEMNPYAKFLGLTATDYREGQGLLTDAWHDRKTKTDVPPFWETIIIDHTTVDKFNWYLDQAYLKRLVPKEPDNSIDVSGLRVSASTHDYNQEDVAKLVNNQKRISAIVDEICAYGFDRRSWLVFAAGNINSELVMKEIASRGVTVAMISDKTDKKERERILADYKAYKIRCIVNNDILTTGFDHNGVDLIAVIRPTTSTSLWVQMLGRGTRPVYADGYDLESLEGRRTAMFASGVHNCLVLDFAGNGYRLGAINNPVKPVAPSKKKKSASKDAPLKLCGNNDCKTMVYATAKVCDECGFEFPLSKAIHDHAATKELVEEKEHQPDIRRMRVTSINFRDKDYYNGGMSISNLHVVYSCGENGKFEERLSFGKLTKRTEMWWQAVGNGQPIPKSTDEFKTYYKAHIKQVAVIDVYMNKPRRTSPEVVRYGFTDESYFDCTD